MKRIIAIAFLASTMGAAVSTAAAQVTSTANIPFAFHVGSTTMPAGVYSVRSADDRSFWLYSKSGHESAMALATTTSGSTAAAKKLVFNRYGNAYFLSAILDGRGECEKSFGPSKIERAVRVEEANLGDEGRVLLALK